MHRHPDSDLLAVLPVRKPSGMPSPNNGRGEPSAPGGCGRQSEHSYSDHEPENAALLALIGMLLLAILLVFGSISDALNVIRGLIPATKMLSSLIHSFAALTVTVLLYVFYKTQS